MKRYFFAFLAVILVLTMWTGCSEKAGQLADQAAGAVETGKQKLEQQVKSILEKYEADVVELKTAVGNLSGTEGDVQFFCAALIRTDSTAIAQGCVDALNKVFTDAGLLSQTGSKIESTHLVHKELTYKRTDFSDGTYYTVYGYHADLASILPTEGK